MAQNEDHFTVGCWSGTYHVPREISDLRGLQLCLDGIISARLGLVCQSFLEQYLNGFDPSVWRVRDLSLNFSLDAGFSDAHGIARDWGQSLASKVLSIVEGEEVSDSILHFPNRAAYLAQFLSDLACGSAWGKWYYEEFSDLQVLSIRQAICSIFLRKEATASDLLLQIASTCRLESVLGALSEDDASLIFSLCFDSAASSSRPDKVKKWAGIVLEQWNSSPLRASSRSENRSRDALRLLARTLSRHPAGEGDLELQAVIHGLLELRQVLLQIRKPSLMDSLFQSLAAFDVQSAFEITVRCGVQNPPESLSFFAELMQGDVAWAQQAAAVVLGESNTKNFLNSTNIQEGEPFLSSFGGIFLLGPSLIDLHFEELACVAAEPSESPEKSAAVLRHLFAAKCFGRERFPDCCDDPALRLFSRFDGTSFRQALEDLDVQRLNLAGAHDILLQTLPGSEESLLPHVPYFPLSGLWPEFELDSKLETFSTLVSHAALRHFSRKLFGFQSSSPGHMYENFLAGASEIRRARNRLEVRLPQSPLSMILRMAGLQEQRYALPWLKGMEVWLLLPQD
jgi:hypothetical protein